MQWFVYILLCNDGTFYTGITTDLARRVKEHNYSNKGAKYTRARRPVSMVFSLEVPDRSTATKLEAHIQKLSHLDKLEIVEGQCESPI